MRKIIVILTLALLSCKTEKEEGISDRIYDTPKKVILSGTVSHFDPEDPNLGFTVNRAGAKRTQLNSRIDSLGNFSVSFESYTPTDVWVSYGANFTVITHPGDHIKMSFDVEKPGRVPMLESIEFSGDAAITNRDAARFQKMYYADEIYTDWDKKEYDVEEYTLYLDTLQQKAAALYDDFVETYNPNEEAKAWAKFSIEQDYYDALVFYPDDHRRQNDLGPGEWDVPVSYYEPLKNRLPIKKSMLKNGYSLENFVNEYYYGYVKTLIQADEDNKKKYEVAPGVWAGSGKELDSLSVYGILQHTEDDLLRQMELAELVRQDLERSKIDLYETYEELLDTLITEPFIAEPLQAYYQETKHRLEEPELATEATLKETSGTSVEKIMEKLFADHKGKVIYIDTWAPWCGPCLSEFPNSKALMEEMEDEDIVFVYFAIDTNEKAYKATLAKYQLGGEHYYLDGNQSADYKSVFDIQAIPYYLLIDKQGNIVDKGSHLRPGNLKDQLKELL